MVNQTRWNSLRGVIHGFSEEARTRGFASRAFARFAFHIDRVWGVGDGFNAEKYLTSALGRQTVARKRVQPG